MKITFSVPPAYGWVILGAGVAPWATSMILGNKVMQARDRLNVPYPNLYAVPGQHPHAEEFNRIQRGHQNVLETMDMYMAATLIGGLKYPKACAIGSLFYMAGGCLYQYLYSDLSHDCAKESHYRKGAMIKMIGFFTSLISSCALARDLIRSA